MYQINNLMRNVLITPAEVIFHAPTKHTLDPRTIEQSIIIAEERFIRPQLDGLYDVICEEKNVTVTADNIATLQAHFDSYTLKVGDIVNAFEFLSANNLKLWKEYLWKLLAECVLVIAFPESWVQFGSQGVMHTVAQMSPMGGEGATGPDLKSVKFMMDKKLMDRIDPLISSMHLFICRAKKLLPTAYDGYLKICACDNEAPQKRTDVILGLYDDPEYNRCGCPTERRDRWY